ncbi:hypothetical protein NA56DRAFT_710636 [Hyaloscypha hepaticicola]|uniref:Uncharacterized protein n=1 Tax=Hyaloscypha hepaticicola TaxID=2082293 RepID=A0A2J6PL33_9HELO|nr:hypothetical protein NA56DRAFT_710636 [Hyaloscypha hepaticicola]
MECHAPTNGGCAALLTPKKCGYRRVRCGPFVAELKTIHVVKAFKEEGGGLRYPTPWGEWKWSDKYQRHYRARLKGPDDWEYEYDQPEDQPRTTTPFGAADLEAPSPSPYPSSSDYTTTHDAEIDDISQGAWQRFAILAID